VSRDSGVTGEPAAGLADLDKRRPLLVGQIGKLVTAHEERVGLVETAAAQFALLGCRVLRVDLGVGRAGGAVIRQRFLPPRNHGSTMPVRGSRLGVMPCGSLGNV